MLKKGTMALAILLVALFAVAAVGAADNATDDIAGLNDNEVIAQEDNQLTLDDANVGSFEELSDLINRTGDGGTLKLEKHYIGSKEIVIDRNITIDGDRHILDGDFQSGIFSIERGNVVLKNIIFLNAKSGYGGAVYAGINSTLTVIDSTFINCSANFGGAITVLSSNASIIESYFENNHATYDGGAIFSMHGILNLTGNTFKDNSANRAGAVYSSLDNLTVMSNYFVNNQAVNVGAIYAMAPKSKSVYLNYFSGNSGLDDFYETVNNNLTIFTDDNYYMFNYEYNDYEVLPKYYNMKDHNLLTPVKDQGVEGNCWAFSAMAVLESCLLKASDGTFDLSESNLKNLMAYFSDWGHAFQTNDGGNRNMAAGYFASWLGPVNEADDLYSMNSLMSPLLKSILHVQNILYLKRTSYKDNDEFKRAILLYGGISTSMYYDDDYMNGYSYYYNGMEGSNHEVCIVGWNDTYSRDNFIDAPGDGAWIVRNSWGPNWGDNGYFYVSYYDTLFAQVNETVAYTIILNDTVKFNRVYQYESHLTSFSNDDVACYKNIFTVEGEEYLAGVSTYFGDKCDYEVTIYLNDNQVSSKRGKTNAGYYTIILDNPFHLNKGDKVTVVFNCTNFVGGNGTIPLSFNSSTVNLYLEEGRSFYLSNWNNWVDLCTSSNAVACIKLFTTLSLDKKINPYIFIDYNENYLDNSYLVNFILPHDALGLLELNTSNNHYIVNLSQTKSIKLYNLGDNNNTLTLRYLGDDRYLETIVNFTILFSSNFKDLESKIGAVETGGVLDLNMNYIFDSASDMEIDISRPITIDGHGHTISGAHQSRIFNIKAENVTLQNIRFIEGNGYDDYDGGAIQVFRSNCQIINCSFINNAAIRYGGAIYWSGNNGVLKDSYFENNTADDGGAIFSFKPLNISNSVFVKNIGSVSAIYLYRSNNISIDYSSFINNDGDYVVYISGNNSKISDSNFINNSVSTTSVCIWGNEGTFNNCTFTDNIGGNGGAVYLHGNNIKITNNTFSDNSADYGGAIFIQGNEIEVFDSSFRNNSANYGGAIYINGNEIEVLYCSFRNNSAINYGGAIYIKGNENKLSNCSFKNNSAITYGGAVYVSPNSEDVVLSDSTFADNSGSHGGAVFWSGANGNLLNSTFINNTGEYQIYWNNIDSGRIAYCKFVNSSKDNVIENGADFVQNPLSLASLQYSIEYKNPTNLSVRFNIVGGVAVSSPITFTIAKNTYNLNMVNDSVVLSDELANLDIGDVQIGVKFAGDDTYDLLESSFTLTVTKAKTSLTLKPANATVGHQTVLSANVYSNNLAITQGSVTFYDGATNIGRADVQNGVATLTYAPTSAGVHSISAEYSDAHYETSRDSFNLYADCASVELSVAPGVVGFKSTFNATVSALYSQITEGSVSFYVDNTLIETVNLQNGVAIVTYAPKTAGTHSVKAVYKSSKFSDAQNTSSYAVSKADSQISLQTSNGKVGYTSTATATVTSNNGQIINEGSVTFYDNGNPIGSVNVQNGAATLKYAPKSAGNRNISAVFSSDNYEKSSDYNMVDVSKAEVSLSINNAGTLSYLDSVTFSISVTSNGNPVSEGRVMFYRGDVLIGTCDVSNGAASCRYNVESFETFDLKAVYAETGNYLALNVTKTFTVNKMPTAITANAITVVYDVTGNLIVSLRDKNGKPLSQASLSVSFNGQKTFTTDNNGRIILSSAGLAPNTYNIVVTYPGDGSYESSSATTHITVQKATPKITAAKKTFKSKLKVKKYSVTLKTHQNKPMAKVTLSIKIKGKKFSARTSAKGKATFKIKKFTKKGNFNAVITFKGNAYYNKVTKTVKIKIK